MSFDPVNALCAFNASRDPERLVLKYAKMRKDAFTFLRGACPLFHARLPDTDVLLRAPAAWICGDLHLENFGACRGSDQQIHFDLNDFDEAVLAPSTHDLLHFLVSLQLAAEPLGFTRHLAELASGFLDAYAATLARAHPVDFTPETSHGMVRDLLQDLEQRQHSQFLDSRTERQGPQRHLRIDGKKALPVTAAQHETIAAFMTAFANRQQTPAFFRLLDVARRIAGTGSLGLERYILLIEGHGSPDENRLLDLKRPPAASLARHVTIRQPPWTDDAVRTVSLQQRLQASPPASLQAVTLGRHSVILRELLPGEDRISLKHGEKPKHLLQLIADMGALVASSHLRGAGWQGAAPAHALQTFAANCHDWQDSLLECANACARQTYGDWQNFAAAWDHEDRRLGFT